MSARFWMKVRVAPANACWEWLATIDRDGYGQFGVKRRIQPAHRVAYRLTGHRLIAGLELDHLCRNRACVNPDHLEQVTHLENMERGANTVKTACPQGHPYDESNTYVTPSGRRNCRACNRIAAARLANRKRMAVS